ncbi:MAG: hypothetical protein Q9163_000498 [Psora crenata]
MPAKAGQSGKGSGGAGIRSGGVAGSSSGASRETITNPASSASIPKNSTFLFRIEPLRPNFDVQQRQTNKHGFWDPPTNRAAYKSGPGSLYQWSDGRAQRVPENDGVQRQMLQPFGAVSVFTQRPSTDHLLAVNFDVRETAVSTQGGWRPLSFRRRSMASKNHYLTYIDPNGTSYNMPAPDTGHWIPQLLPPCYNPGAQSDAHGRLVAPTTVNGGLIGRLPLLIALAGFSAPESKMSAVIEQCIRPNTWRRHSLVSGRDYEHRGMVVTVYLDPANPRRSTSDFLTKLENGDYGPFYGR